MLPTYSRFKNKYTYKQRFTEASNILIEYPHRIPVVCEKNVRSTNAPEIDKNKYLVPFDLTIGQFLHVIRKRIKLTENEALFLTIGQIIPSNSSLMGNLYSYYKSGDLFLYIIYSTENTFG